MDGKMKVAVMEAIGKIKMEEIRLNTVAKSDGIEQEVLSQIRQIHQNLEQKVRDVDTVLGDIQSRVENRAGDIEQKVLSQIENMHVDLQEKATANIFIEIIMKGDFSFLNRFF